MFRFLVRILIFPVFRIFHGKTRSCSRFIQVSIKIISVTENFRILSRLVLNFIQFLDKNGKTYIPRFCQDLSNKLNKFMTRSFQNPNLSDKAPLKDKSGLVRNEVKDCIMLLLGRILFHWLVRFHNRNMQFFSGSYQNLFKKSHSGFQSANIQDRLNSDRNYQNNFLEHSYCFSLWFV